MPSYYPGQVVNGYEIIECVNSGSFATAYRVRKGGKSYFLKEYGDPTEGAPDFKQFVAQQSAINSKLCSLRLGCLEHLVDTFITGYRYHQVKDFLYCVDLTKYLETDLDLDNRLFICRLWLGILNELSGAGIVHQDLKPAQILMVKKSSVRLGHFMIFADFDWAILDGRMVRQVCTPGYATPEHLTGATPTVASDLYQSGVVLYEILTGRLPFYHAGEYYDPAVARERMERQDFAAPADVQPVVPAWASAIITAMLTWNATARPGIAAVISAWDRKAPLECLPPDPPPKPDSTDIDLTPPPGVKVPEWIRLRHASGATMAYNPGETQVTRSLFHGPFRHVSTPAGHAIASYFPSDETIPLFIVRQDADGWVISGSSHRNYGIFNGNRLENSNWVPIRNGDRLEIYSRNEASVVAEFSFEVPM